VSRKEANDSFTLPAMTLFIGADKRFLDQQLKKKKEKIFSCLQFTFSRQFLQQVRGFLEKPTN
jgi:hypothetical protein